MVQTLNEEINRNDDRTMLGYLLGNTQISPIVAKHLRKSMELRRFDKPEYLQYTLVLMISDEAVMDLWITETAPFFVLEISIFQKTRILLYVF